MRGRDFSELPQEGGTEGGHSAPLSRTVVRAGSVS
jgi:hypothetical protein